MIELYTFMTPNGFKASILLEELGLPYQVHSVNILKGEQFDPTFLAISPNNKIPAMVDPDGPDGKPLAIFESGAILIYLAQKMKSPLLPTEPRAFSSVMSWLFFQVGGVGPMFGQMNHFGLYAPEKVPYGIKRYTDEGNRLLSVMDKRLGESPFIAGPDYSIADIACYPWIRSAESYFRTLDAWPNVKAWANGLALRPAVQRGMQVPQ